MRLRSDVNKALELARAEKTIGKPLDAEVTLSFDGEGAKAFAGMDSSFLPTLFIVSKVTVSDAPVEGMAGTDFQGVTVAVAPSAAPKCVRCWTHDERIGGDPVHPELCPRCAAAVSE